MTPIPKDYTLSKFFQYSGKPEKCGKNYRASCPHCREGKSWLIKKRLYFFPDKNAFYYLTFCTNKICLLSLTYKFNDWDCGIFV